MENQQSVTFPTTCPCCKESTETNVCIIDIPLFKEIILMNLLCERCGYRSNEVKTGGSIPPFGTILTVYVTTVEDLSREVLKSDTALISIPELELEWNEGCMGGVYTTLEGLLLKIHDDIENGNTFVMGDSSEKGYDNNDFGKSSPSNLRHFRLVNILHRLKNMAEGTMFPFTITVSDPLSNSFIGPLPDATFSLSEQAKNSCGTNFLDEGLSIQTYFRSNQQNESLGLIDSCTENLQQDASEIR